METTKLESGICIHCECKKDDHHSTTLQCVGSRDPHSYAPYWSENTFEDSGLYTIESEALSIASDTGLTPRQLLEQRNEIIKDIRSVLVEIDHMQLEDVQFYATQRLSEIVQKTTKAGC